MSEDTNHSSIEEERELLLDTVRLLNNEIRRRLSTLVEHPAISDSFKGDSLVAQWLHDDDSNA
jgi:hypothetical protein